MVPDMDNERYLQCLAADVARLREVAVDRLAAPVPSCPGWSVEQLVFHVATVFAHKVACMRAGAPPDPWPPPDTGAPRIALLEQAYAELSREFASREPTEPTFTFYPPDRSVGFWVRRMAQEAAVHRVDAELAAGTPTPVPADLALDGVEEMLVVFVGWGVRAFREQPSVAGVLARADGRPVGVRCGDRGWLVRPTSDGVEVGEQDPAGAPATVSGPPAELLLWLWGRAGDEAVSIEGDTVLVDYLREVMAQAGQ